jgi:uncharacterized protein YaiL (DUF2058 family)
MAVKRVTRYEQVPIAVAKKIALRESKLVVIKTIPAGKENPASSRRAV